MPRVLAAVPSLLVACALALPAAAAADPLPGQVLVGFADGATASQRAAARGAVGATEMHAVGDHGDQQSLTVPGASDATLAALRARPGVTFAEPVYRTAASFTPPNVQVGSQWPMFNTGLTGGVRDDDLDADRAWDLIGPGSASVLVGIADSGLQPDHPAFKNLNIWTNPGEAGSTAGAGKDDDGNGCVDDLHGCDTVTRGAKPFDENGHGTAVAGIVFSGWAASNPYAGIAPASTLIPAKVLDATGSGTTAQLAAGLSFLGDQGARVVNVSVGGPYSEAVHQAIANHPNTLFVASAGNSGVNVDQAASYPCEDPSANVICVAATDSSDRLTSFSNYGSAGVDLGAPGASVPSTALGGGTGAFSGTSFAAPMVTGTAALAFAAKPSATVAEVKTNILWAVDGSASLTGKVATGGRVNAYQTVAHLLGVPVTPRPAVATGGGPATSGAAGTTGTTGSFAKQVTKATTKTSTTTTASTLSVRAKAHRAGARAIHVRLTCVAAAGCTGTVTLNGGGTTASPKLKLKRNASSTVTLKVKQAAKVKSVAVWQGSGALGQKLTVPVAKK